MRGKLLSAWVLVLVAGATAGCVDDGSEPYPKPLEIRLESDGGQATRWSVQIAAPAGNVSLSESVPVPGNTSRWLNTSLTEGGTHRVTIAIEPEPDTAPTPQHSVAIQIDPANCAEALNIWVYLIGDAVNGLWPGEHGYWTCTYEANDGHL